MTNLLYGSYDGSAVSPARINSSCLGLYGRYDYIIERLENDVDGSVDVARVINPSEVVMDGNVATSFGLHKVSSVRRDLEYPVAGV